MHTSSKQHHRTETQPVLLNILRNRNSDVDVNDTLFTVTCHISLCTAWNWHIWIQLKGMSFTQARPQAGLNMQRCWKLDRVRFVLCGTWLLSASPPAVKYTTAKFHTSLYAAKVTRKHPANTYGLATEAKEGNSFIKYSANYAQPVSSVLWGLTHSLPQVIVHVLLVKAYLVQHADQEPILLCVVLPLVCLVVHHVAFLWPSWLWPLACLFPTSNPAHQSQM